MLGCALLAAGIFAQIEIGALEDIGVDGLLYSPSIILICLGGVMFILGFCGCLGALREVFILLVIVSRGGGQGGREGVTDGLVYKFHQIVVAFEKLLFL